MYLQLLLVFVIVFKTAYSERGEPCTTPNEEAATCVPATSCKVIFEAALTGSQDDQEFAQKSQCGYDTELLLCCGTTGSPKTKTAPRSNVASPSPPPVALFDFDTSELPDRSVCGLEKKRDKIFGGKVTTLEEFPWIAALEYKNKLTGEKEGIKCTGSVINNKFVLTAAHCLFSPEFELVSVRLGEWNITTDPDCLPSASTIRDCADPVQSLSIKEAIPHGFYNSRTGSNNIALLRLEKKITFSDYIRPICFPPINLPNPEPGSKVTLAGWVLTGADQTSNVKLKIELPVRPNSLCEEELKRTLEQYEVCAGGEKGKDTCLEAAGGPWMRIYEDPVTKASNWYLDGFVSSSAGCGREGYPVAYFRITRYLNWIINTIEEDFV